MTGAPKLSVIVPVFREEGSVRPFLARLVPVLASIGAPYEIIFALDPAPDGTETEIRRAIGENPQIRLLLFSRRFGQPAATMAGLMNCSGEHAVVIDIDLQDPPELIPAMLEKALQGSDVIYARRRSRAGETLMKRAIASAGYTLINRWSEAPIPRDTGDFRIVTRRVIEELRKLKETHGFLRGLVAVVGFPQDEVLYDRAARHSGRGHYNRLSGSMRIGLNGLVSFSSRPLQMLWVVALMMMLVQAMVLLGWACGLIAPNLSVLLHLFLAALQFAGLALLGEYVGRIYDEVKGRPAYIIAEKVNFTQMECGSTGPVNKPE